MTIDRRGLLPVVEDLRWAQQAELNRKKPESTAMIKFLDPHCSDTPSVCVCACVDVWHVCVHAGVYILYVCGVWVSEFECVRVHLCMACVCAWYLYIIRVWGVCV